VRYYNNSYYRSYNRGSAWTMIYIFVVGCRVLYGLKMFLLVVKKKAKKSLIIPKA
jgi:hypothetical protein